MCGEALGRSRFSSGVNPDLSWENLSEMSANLAALSRRLVLTYVPTFPDTAKDTPSTTTNDADNAPTTVEKGREPSLSKWEGEKLGVRAVER